MGRCSTVRASKQDSLLLMSRPRPGPGPDMAARVVRNVAAAVVFEFRTGAESGESNGAPAASRGLSRFTLQPEELIAVCRVKIVEHLYGLRCYTSSFRREVTRQRLRPPADSSSAWSSSASSLSSSSSLSFARPPGTVILRCFAPLRASMDGSTDSSQSDVRQPKSAAAGPGTTPVMRWRGTSTKPPSSLFQDATGDIPDVGTATSKHGWHEHAAAFQRRDKAKTPLMRIVTAQDDWYAQNQRTSPPGQVLHPQQVAHDAATAAAAAAAGGEGRRGVSLPQRKQSRPTPTLHTSPSASASATQHPVQADGSTSIRGGSASSCLLYTSPSPRDRG